MSLQAKARHSGVEMDRGRQLSTRASAIGCPFRHLFEASQNRPNAKLIIKRSALGKEAIENVDRRISGEGTKRFGFGGGGHKKGAASFLREGRGALVHAEAVGIRLYDRCRLRSLGQGPQLAVVATDSAKPYNKRGRGMRRDIRQLASNVLCERLRHL